MEVPDDARRLLTVMSADIHVEDALMHLYAFIAETPNASFGWLHFGSDAVHGVHRGAQVHLWRSTLRRCIGERSKVRGLTGIAGLGGALSRIAASGYVSDEDSRSLVTALLVLDDSFDGVHVGEVLADYDEEGFVELRSRLRNGRPLFAMGSYSALPRPRRAIPFVPRGQGIVAELLRNLAIVKEKPPLTVRNSIMFHGSDRPVRGFDRIGIIPTINEHAELEWIKDGPQRYRVDECLAAKQVVRDRVRAGLNLLCDAGVDLILMPELVSSTALTELVGLELRTRSDIGKATPYLVLAGTSFVLSDGRTRNRATLFNGRGDVVWVQDKMHAYTFTVREQAESGHPLGQADLADRCEAMDPEPRTLHLVDLSATQRVAVLTCEDFIQPEPHQSVVAEAATTLILVPIMSGRRESSAVGWIHDGALNYARRPGATSVIANSGTLLNGPGEGWQYGHVVAEPRVSADWQQLPPDGKAVAWLTQVAKA
jgi:predicted amidohydrolase